MIEHTAMRAWALCWPNDPHPLLYEKFEAAEQDRIWFTKNYKTTPQGAPRGEPYLLELIVKNKLPPLPKPLALR